MDRWEAERERVLKGLDGGDREGLLAWLGELHAVDIAELLGELDPPSRLALFQMLPTDRAGLVLEEADPELQAEILGQLGAPRAARVLGEMSSDTIADLLAEVEPEQAEELLQLLPADEAADVEVLLSYPEDTAGGIMTTEVISLREEVTADEAIAALRRVAPDAETIYYVFVTDAERRLVGVISLRDLIVAPPDRPIGEVMRRQVIRVEAHTDQEEVARIVAKYDLLAVPVVDEEERLLGIVTVDDVIDVIEEEASEDIALLSNVDPEEREEGGGPWRWARGRLPWLVGLLFGELLAGSVIHSFEAVLSQFTVLALFITVMAGTAGNVGTQSLAVVVRGIATGAIEPRRMGGVIWGEVRVGMLVGAVSGAVLALAAWAWQGSALLGGVVGLSLGLNMVVASLLGSFFPLVITRFGLDPAVASGPFITTLTDVISMGIYFGLASAILLRGL